MIYKIREVSLVEKICPICNKIEVKNICCSRCNGIMVDEGRVQEYMGPYGAEMPIKDSEEYCLHLYCCEKCNFMKRIYIKKIVI